MKPAHYALTALTGLFSMLGVDEANAQKQQQEVSIAATPRVKVSQPGLIVMQAREKAFNIALACMSDRNPALDSVKSDLIRNYDFCRLIHCDEKQLYVSNKDTIAVGITSDESSISVEVANKAKKAEAEKLQFWYSRDIPEVIGSFKHQKTGPVDDSTSKVDSQAFILSFNSDKNEPVYNLKQITTSYVRNKFKHMIAMRTYQHDGTSDYVVSYRSESVLGEHAFKTTEMSQYGVTITDRDKETARKHLLFPYQNDSQSSFHAMISDIGKQWGYPILHGLAPYIEPLQKHYKP